MRRPIIVTLSALAVLGGLMVAAPAASASTFTVSPWAYACSHTTYGNPVGATDPGATCDHNGATAGLGTGYCPDADQPGSVGAAYTGGALALTKVGPQCDDMAAGATIGGLVTLTAASFDATGDVSGGSPRLNVTDAALNLFFVSCPVSGGHADCDVSALAGKTLSGIDIIVDAVPDNESATVILSNLSFTGSAPAPTPNPCATPSPSSSPSASPSPSQEPSPSPSPSEQPSPSPSAEPSPSPSEEPTPTVTLTAFVQAACPTKTPKPPTTGVGYDPSSNLLPGLALLTVMGLVALGAALLPRRRSDA